MEEKNISTGPAKKHSPIIRVLSILLSLVFSALVIGSLSVLWKVLPIQIAWKTMDWSWDRQSIEKVTIGSDGEPWFIIKGVFNHNYQLHHVTNGQVNSWNLPPLTFGEMAESEIIGDNGNNKPWLIIKDRLLHWDGNQWEIFPMPLDAIFRSYPSCPQIAIKGLTVWGIGGAGRIIRLELDQDPLQAHEIFLPGDLGSNNYHMDCFISANEGVFSVFLSNDIEIAVYQLKGSDWQRVTAFEKKYESLSYLNDAVVDSSGQIWIVLFDPVTETKVGEYNPQENTWRWLDIEHPGIANRKFEYTQITVDELGRIWLSATQYQPRRSIRFFPVFDASDIHYTDEYTTVGVYVEAQGNKLVEVQHYTTKNSSLENNRESDLLMGPDKRIWTWDNQLVWTDSSARRLPSALPRWVSSVADLYDVDPFSLIYYIFLFVVLIGLLVQRVRHKRESN